jgi:hypothetical protein
MSYITLKGHWCDIVVLNMHAPIEDKDDDMKDSYYEELEYVFSVCVLHFLFVVLYIYRQQPK